MNHGKICVSVCAKTADELIEQITRAEELADMIEIRFDCLAKDELDQFDLPSKENYLFTYRPREQGGTQDLSLEERERFWWSVIDFGAADFEEDLIKKELNKFFRPLICSHHDFIRVPQNLFKIYERILSGNEDKIDVVKIAVQTNDITDSIPIWQLLKRARSENKEIIPIAMGESGKWTRILGLAHGAFMTYASLDSAKETAPGQVTAKELIEVYRAKELDQTTEVFGILGNNTGVSLSPLIHNTAFKFHQLNSVFVPLQVHDLDEFIARMVRVETREIDLNFKGFAVTIPHKKNIIKHLDFLDETAEKIGAVNTVKIVDGKLHGYNTDAEGFIVPLKKVFGNLDKAKVAMLGSGGSAKACLYALGKENSEVTIFTGNEIRSPDFKSRSFSEFDIVINTTPLGMKGKLEGETPLSAKQMKGVKLVYDLVYIPPETELIKQAKSLGIRTLGGIEMLIEQAVEQQRIWNGSKAPIVEIRKVVSSKF